MFSQDECALLYLALASYIVWIERTMDTVDSDSEEYQQGLTILVACLDILEKLEKNLENGSQQEEDGYH